MNMAKPLKGSVKLIKSMTYAERLNAYTDNLIAQEIVLRTLGRDVLKLQAQNVAIAKAILNMAEIGKCSPEDKERLREMIM